MKTIEQLQEENAALAAHVAELQQFCLTAAEVQEIRAEAGRAGFVEGYDSCWFEHYGTRAQEHSYSFAANQYADSIRQGEVK